MSNKFQIESLAIADVKLVKPAIFRDSRGCFSETYNAAALRDAGIDADFVQDNHSVSARRGVIRGLHFQTPPHPQGKLVRVTRGRIMDVAVDIRIGSPTFGRHVAVTLSADDWSQLWIPVGFAHAFCTLEDNCEVLYKVTDYYAPDCDAGIFWNDPAIGIEWPISESEVILSEKDIRLPVLSKLPNVFQYTA